MFKKTKIVATLGPSSDNKQTILEMVKNGVNVFRLNFSHGTHEYHKKNLDIVREVEKELGIRIGVLQDISGPKIRIGKLENTFTLKIGDHIVFKKEEILGKQIMENRYETCINHPEILDMLKLGEYIYLYDGAVRAKVIKVGEYVETIIENDGVITSNKGVNFPNTRINVDIITPKDKLDMEWGAKNGVNFVAISFVQNANDVIKARKILSDFNSDAKLYAKIEKFDAVENIDEILEICDGIMVARGDLGIEVPFYEVPNIQKKLIAKANNMNKPVITATQMMLSMTEHDRATRAEISDVANAVLDGTDAVMLSEESAIGKHPPLVVKAMANTIRETEKLYPYNKFDKFSFFDETDMIASSASKLATNIGACGILSITGSGKSAIKMSRNRPKMDILAIAHDEQTAHSLCMVWGVEPILVKDKIKVDDLITSIIKDGLKKHLISDECTYVMTAGLQTGVEGSTNYIRIIKKDQIDYYKNL
ncbi:pyruvate kinase [Campylobacter sputorum]|uniref:pyruvate kinase n=1 Tax=Campylobacter sputorum TaxID=206 RepID=UPI000B76C2AC|nr:pyruvate kinase [Campylobacter sputorum]ASM37256.1 pyruvate kinase I [Campylobacter sputorum bv. faecalis CCUG 20703]